MPLTPIRQSCRKDAAARIGRKVSANGRRTFHGFNDIVGLQVHGVQVRFVRQIFGQTQNQLKRIVHVMRDAGGERADSSKFLCMEQFGLQCRFMLHEYPEKPCGLAR